MIGLTFWKVGEVGGNKYLLEGKFESTSSEEFIKAYLETVEAQSDASNKKLKPLELISAEFPQV